MCTVNLRSATENLYKFIQTKDIHTFKTSIQYYGIICSFIIGAIIGSFITNIFFTKAIFFSLIALMIVFFLMFIKEVEEH